MDSHATADPTRTAYFNATLLLTGAALLYYVAKRYTSNYKVKLYFAASNPATAIHSSQTLHDILKRCPSLTSPTHARFVPTPYLFAGLLQTAYPMVNARKRDHRSDITYTRELLTLSDGGTVSLDWAFPEARDDHTPVAIIMSGIGGSSREYVVRRIVKALTSDPRAKYIVAVMNHRGCARTPLTSWRLYDAFYTQDFREAVDHVSRRYSAALVGIGLSLGANLLTKYLGEEGGACKLRAAVSVCCAFDVAASSRALSTCTVLNKYVIAPTMRATLLRTYRANKKTILEPPAGAGPAEPFDGDEIEACMTMHDLEVAVVLKSHGFKSHAEYCDAASGSNYVCAIRVPYLAINSLDDMITPSSGIPFGSFAASPWAVLAVVEHGGHLGFVGGWRAMDIWYHGPAIEFLNAVVFNAGV